MSGRSVATQCNKILFYYCKLYSDIKSAYLETIEHNCKYNDPELHRSEILRLLDARNNNKLEEKFWGSAQ